MMHVSCCQTTHALSCGTSWLLAAVCYKGVHMLPVQKSFQCCLTHSLTCHCNISHYTSGHHFICYRRCNHISCKRHRWHVILHTPPYTCSDSSMFVEITLFDACQSPHTTEVCQLLMTLNKKCDCSVFSHVILLSSSFSFHS